MGIQHPLGVSPAPEYTLGYSCAFCGGAIPDQQPESYRGYCDTGCKRASERMVAASPAALRGVLPLTDADVNEAESRELVELSEGIHNMLPERVRRALYEAGFNVDTVSVDEGKGEYELDVRSADQRCTVTIKWEG